MFHQRARSKFRARGGFENKLKKSETRRIRTVHDVRRLTKDAISSVTEICIVLCRRPRAVTETRTTSVAWPKPVDQVQFHNWNARFAWILMRTRGYPPFKAPRVHVYRSPEVQTQRLGNLRRSWLVSMFETLVSSSSKKKRETKWWWKRNVSRSKGRMVTVWGTGSEKKIRERYPTSDNDRPSRSSVTRGFIIVVIVNPD